jgi:Tol biopolymer transport system component
MVRGAVGIDAKRAFILLAAAALTVFLGVTLVPGEPAAQTAPPNGKIAYVGFDAETQKQDVYSMNPDGTGVTNLTRRYTDPNWSPLGNAHGNPEWSPDGTKISFTGTALSDIGSCCSRNVYVMDADGANLRRLTTSPSTSEGEDFQATWAPDGSWLAFVSTRGDPYDDRDIYRMDADGTNQQQLTFVDPDVDPNVDPPARVSDEQPSVSPDGTEIAFASNTHYDDTESGSYHVDQLDIYVMDSADGGNVRRLTSDASPTSPTLNLESRSQNPAWSPDGSRIAYESTKSGNSEIWVMNADGTGEPVNVSQHEAWDSDPAWSPDGTQITFMSRRAGQDDVWVVDAPPTTPSTPVALLTFSLGADAAWAASAPRNLTANSSIKAGSPDWGTAPSGNGNVCTISGTARANTLNGTSDADVICGLGGNDTVYGAGGNDVIKGGSGSDTLKGQGDDDEVIGNSGSDKLFGGGGDDTVNSKDTISGNDALDGGTHVAGDKKVTDSTEKSIVGIP